MMSYHLSDDQLIGYIHQTLTDAEREEIDRHVAGCAQCRGMLSDYEAMQRRISYGLSNDLKKVHPPATMSFAAVAPRLRRFWGVTALMLAVDRPLTAVVTLAMVALMVIGIFAILTRSAPNAGSVGMMFRANPQHTGIYYTDSLPQRGEVAWSFMTKGSIPTSPVLADGMVYFGSNDRTLYALDSQTGQTRWSFALPEVGTSPAVVDGTLYIGSGSSLVALDSRTGQKKWKSAAVDCCYMDTSPVVVDGEIYAKSRGYLRALDIQTGQEKWKFKLNTWTASSPAVADGTVYFGDATLVAVDSQTGSLKWKFSDGGKIAASPSIAGGVVYVGSYDGIFYAVDSQTGQLKWKFKAGAGGFISSPAVADGMVYFGNGRTLYALDSQTGQVLWTSDTGSLVESSPAVAGDEVYVGSFDGYLYALDRFTGQQKWRFKTGGGIDSSPAVGDGLVYFGSMDQRFYAVR